MDNFSEGIKYDKAIWLDSEQRLTDVLKIALISRIDQNKKAYECFLEDIEKLSPDFIKKTLCKLKYTDFLRTPYWQMIASIVKSEKDMVCENCGKRFNKNMFLDAHHKDYSIHGEEHLHMNELVCLCDFCHKNLHQIV